VLILRTTPVYLHIALCLGQRLMDRKVLSGHPFGTWKDREGKELCMHADKEAAKDTIKRMRELSEMEGVHLALAHVPLEERNDPFLKSLLLE